MKKRIILLIMIVIVIAVAVYFTFFYTRKCPDRACFNLALGKCSRVSFLNDVEDATWFYKIKGKSGGSCEINVKLLKLKEGTTDLIGLEGKDMICFLPLGYTGDPQDNLDICQGLLKEEMQTVIITRLHNYIVDNLGEIAEGLGRVV